MSRWRTRFHVKVAQPINNLIWRFWSGDTTPFRFHHRIHLDKIPVFAPELDLDRLRESDPKVFNYVIDRYTEYAYEFTFPLTIEPKRAWLIPEPFRVIEESFPLVNDPWDGIKPRPSTLDYLRRRRTLELERAIVVSFAWHNYYHFFIDTLPQLALLDALGVERDIPIVVPPQFATTKYVREFLEIAGFLRGREFVVQEPRQHIRVNKATYVAKDVFFSQAIPRILDTLDFAGRDDRGERIFLRRDPKRPRSLTNDAVITRIAEESGYRVVDTAQLSLREQALLFRGAVKVIGIHGAGLTNIIFRRGLALRVLEIFPAGLGATHYRDLCRTLGYDYSRTVGGYLDGNHRFELPSELFKQALVDLESGGSGTPLTTATA